MQQKHDDSQAPSGGGEGEEISQDVKRLMDIAAREYANRRVGGTGDEIIIGLVAEAYRSGIKEGYLMKPAADLTQKKEPVLLWVNASERSPNGPGYYHTNIGLTEWGSHGTGELFWFNRQGGFVTEWLESIPSSLPDGEVKDQDREAIQGSIDQPIK